MSKKYLVYPLVMLFLYIMQFVAVPLSYKGIAPDLLFLLTVTAGIRENPRFAALVGLFAGLLCDYTSGLAFGLRGIIYMLIGWFLAVLTAEALSPNVLTAFFAAVADFILTRLIFWAEYLVLRGAFSPSDMFMCVTLPEAVMTLPLTPVVYGLAALLTGRYDNRGRHIGREV